MAGRMESGDNQQRLICHLVDDAVGEPVRKNPPDIPAPMATGGEQGIGGQCIDCVKDGLDEFTAQSCFLFFVPGCGVAYIGLRLRAEY